MATQTFPKLTSPYSSINYRINNITHITVAVRDIALGEELTVSYIDCTIPHAERTRRLHDWGFTCSCAACSASAAEIAESDARLERIRALEAALDNFAEERVTAHSGGQLAALYETERLDIYLGPAYTRAAINYALFGDVVNAQAFAKLAIEAVLRESGPLAEDLAPMRALAEDPRKHWSWGRRRTDNFEDEDDDDDEY
jgi:hypothetical protein